MNHEYSRDITNEINIYLSRDARYDREKFISSCIKFLENDFNQYSIDVDGIAFYHSTCHVYLSDIEKDRFIYRRLGDFGSGVEVLDLKWFPRHSCNVALSGSIHNRQELDQFVMLVEGLLL